MHSLRLLFFTLVISFLLGCERTPSSFYSSSPGNKISVRIFECSNRIGYQVLYDSVVQIDSSFIGFDFLDSPSFSENLIITNWTEAPFSEEWEMPWGEQRLVQNNYNEIKLEISETSEPKRVVNLVFRVYDDGLGFRYEFPAQPNWSEVTIMDENTEFRLTGDHMTWWIPGDWDIYEHLYNTTRVSEIDAISKRGHKNLAATTIPENAVNTPVTMKTRDGIYLSLHEADLTDYAGMTLKVDTNKFKFTSELVGAPEGHKVKRQLPFATPWRTIQLAESAGDLIESNLIVNLNEPADSTVDVSWFRPMKYVGIWWEMHMNKSTWQYKGGKHGATTENAKRHIDFAAENGFGGVLIEGWNTGWERWIGFPDREGVFDFVTPYPDYDLEEVVSYGKLKNVDVIMHHETSAAPRTYEQQLDTAFSLMKSLGIHSVKTGYVGPIIPDGERHHGQWMVNHYHMVLEKALASKIAINAHEPIKGTGKRRTYPNAISREGLRGQEFNAWSIEKGNPPEHLTIVPFTRMLAGPIDFTPGIFNIEMKPYKTANNSRVNTTVAHQLGLYVVIYSPIQMAADLIEHYDNKPEFQFIRDVAVDWEQSKVLDGEIGEYIVIARQERDGQNWYVGGVTDENNRTYNLNFDFLADSISYDAIVYRDGEEAHWESNPYPVAIDSLQIDNTMTLPIELAPGGGFAISLIAQE